MPVDELGELDVAGVGAGHGLAGDRAVEDRARGGEAHRAGGDGLGDEPAHLGDVVGGGVLVAHAALAHHLEAQRAVGELGGDVERVAPRRRGSRGTPGSSPTRPTARPRARALPGMSSTPSISSISVACSPGGHGAKPDAAVAHDERGDPVAERRVELVVPGRLPVVVRVHVDPARRHDGAVGVDGAVALEAAADGGDAPVVDRDVAGERGRPPCRRRSCRPGSPAHVPRQSSPQTGPARGRPARHAASAGRDPDRRPVDPGCYPVSGSRGATVLLMPSRLQACN